jgi:hypothetical protein
MAQHTQNTRLIELGVAQVGNNSRDLGLAIAALAQEGARARIGAAAPAALTDSSGGTADGAFALSAVVTPTAGTVDGVASLAPKTAFDTAMGLIDSGHMELAAKVNELIVLVAGAAGATLDDQSFTPNDTVEALTASLTGTTADDAAAPAQDAKVQIIAAASTGAAIAAALNYVRVAAGYDVIADHSGGIFDRDQDTYETATQAATGTAAANAEDGVTVATANAALTAINNNIASLTAATNQMRGTLNIGPFVVATHNPRSRFKTGNAA